MSNRIKGQTSGGDHKVFRVDTSGRLETIGGGSTASSKSASTAAEASRVVKDSAGTLFSVRVFNNDNATRYLQVFDTAAVPADAVVPLITKEVATLTSAQIDFPQGLPMGTGICVCLSSTPVAKTVAGAVGLFLVNYA